MWPMSSARFGGVDVGARRKGFHCAVVGGGGRVELALHRSAREAAAWLATRAVAVAAVDAPRAPAPAGRRSRDCERLLAAQVCGIRYTPDRTGLRSHPTYYAWIEHGFELYDACRAAGIETVECFPTASWSRWSGPRRGRSRAAWTAAALSRHAIVDVPARLNQDERDAIGAALTARAYARGETESYGDIVVPLPTSRLPEEAVRGLPVTTSTVR
jgi:predicted nuclease with RNAse H fold